MTDLDTLTQAVRELADVVGAVAHRNCFEHQKRKAFEISNSLGQPSAPAPESNKLVIEQSLDLAMASCKKRGKDEERNRILALIDSPDLKSDLIFTLEHRYGSSRERAESAISVLKQRIGGV